MGRAVTMTQYKFTVIIVDVLHFGYSPWVVMGFSILPSDWTNAGYVGEITPRVNGTKET